VESIPPSSTACFLLETGTMESDSLARFAHLISVSLLASSLFVSTDVRADNAPLNLSI
jgi:hypothetical protein